MSAARNAVVASDLARSSLPVETFLASAGEIVRIVRRRDRSMSSRTTLAAAHLKDGPLTSGEAEAAAGEQTDGATRRFELTDQLRRQDLYVLGDLTKAQYVMRRQALQDEIERLAPPADPQLTQAERLLSDFAAFWEAETSPAERHRLLSTLFEQVWQDDGTIVAVKPRGAFVPYFQAATQTTKSRSGSSGVQSGSDGTRNPRPLL